MQRTAVRVSAASGVMAGSCWFPLYVVFAFLKPDVTVLCERTVVTCARTCGVFSFTMSSAAFGIFLRAPASGKRKGEKKWELIEPFSCEGQCVYVR